MPKRAAKPGSVRARVKKCATAQKKGGPGKQLPLNGRVTDRDLDIYNRFVSGERKRHIAVDLGIDHSTVHKAIKRVSDFLQLEMIDDIRAIRVEHTARLQHIADEAMEAWRQSKQPGVVETTTTDAVAAGDGKKPTGTKQVRKTYNVGNVAYLSQAQSALEDIRKIWGVDMKREDPPPTEEGDRVAGMSREDAIRQQMQRLQMALEPGVN